jgi:hypothetical protein
MPASCRDNAHGHGVHRNRDLAQVRAPVDDQLTHSTSAPKQFRGRQRSCSAAVDEQTLRTSNILVGPLNPHYSTIVSHH